jgi:hypothetical protein
VCTTFFFLKMSDTHLDNPFINLYVFHIYVHIHYLGDEPGQGRGTTRAGGHGQDDAIVLCGALSIRHAIQDCLELDVPAGGEAVGTLRVEHPTMLLCARC